VKLKDRIKGLERIPARDLLPHPQNWRTHPREQRDALRGILADVGIADALLVRETPDGYQILDGHCRAEEAPDVEWPCLVVDLSDAEAEKLLVTHDPIGAMAEADAETLRELLAGVSIDQETLAAMGMIASEGEETERKPIRHLTDDPLHVILLAVHSEHLPKITPMLEELERSQLVMYSQSIAVAEDED